MYGGQDVPGSDKESAFAGVGRSLTNSASWVKDRTVAGASSVQNSAGQRDWSREKGWLNSAGQSAKGAALWTKDKTVSGASSVSKAAQERDWSREKGYAASAGSAAKSGAVAVGGGVKAGAQFLWNASTRKTEVVDTPPTKPSGGPPQQQSHNQRWV